MSIMRLNKLVDEDEFKSYEVTFQDGATLEFQRADKKLRIKYSGKFGVIVISDFSIVFSGELVFFVNKQSNLELRLNKKNLATLKEFYNSFLK